MAGTHYAKSRQGQVLDDDHSSN